MEVFEPPAGSETAKLTVFEVITIHLGDALSSVPVDYVSTPDSDRQQAIAVIGSIITLVQAIAPDAGRRIAVPLNQARDALIELNFGVVVPMLRAKPKAGRPPDSLERVALRAIASGIMSILLDLGLTRRNSAEKVAAALRAKKFEDVSWNTIAQWRDQIMRPGKPHPARCFHDMVISKERGVLEELRRQPLNETAKSRYTKDLLERFSQYVEEQRFLSS